MSDLARSRWKLFSFTAVAVLTIMASMSFDPRLIWQSADE